MLVTQIHSNIIANLYIKWQAEILSRKFSCRITITDSETEKVWDALTQLASINESPASGRCNTGADGWQEIVPSNKRNKRHVATNGLR